MSEWTAADLPDSTGRTVLVTGAGRGIGWVTARELGRAGARVVLGVRDPDRARAAVAGLAGEFDVRRLDVSDLSSVREFAAAWTGPLDVLVNNAGVMDTPAARTADGLERQTATNYTGPFVLTNLLLPHVTGRVVSVTSQLHRLGKVDVADLDWRTRTYRPMQAYRDSKLAQVLFSLELQRRFTAISSPVRSVLAHPGIAHTGLVDHSSQKLVLRLGGPLLNDVEHGALPTLFAATQDVRGNAYVGPDGLGSVKGHPTVRRQARKGLDEETARALWAATEALTGVRAEF
ncbi:SDR family NAD(P)-dependent oxidoreductase [Modestobacter sp. VKM Ac-2984]|uniref:SDR family NAD(P)-dependent oxidoreductase n=1 Tax=Modestobacter sp. VKM Ac-2984 TaxID=3004138 RepID=UPI0022AAEEA7|nr:SDR family NAD(P)-dependent oxidoreductase [Modestobacter sp. VKM Ac-2984]MCZ2818175.1 SDR family NAD(P)-dependent oxidoreductase [Modestobacter sp. VKM Ac-2984]